MFQTDYSLVTFTMDQKVKAALRQADSRRMQRAAGLDRRLRSWLYRLGKTLVTLGQRLEHSDVSRGISH